MKKESVVALVFFVGSLLIQPPAAIAAGQIAWIPYNVSAGVWATGLHIAVDSNGETITMAFADDEDIYDTVSFTSTGSHFLTDLVPAFIAPTAFRTPSLIMISSQLGFFSATQFVSNGIGFSHITVESVPMAGVSAMTTSPSVSSLKEKLLEKIRQGEVRDLGSFD